LTPASAKNKGRLLQQWVQKLIIQHFPSLTVDDVRSTSMGAGGEDIQLSTEARKFVPYQIECKSKARSQIHTIYEQAKEHGKHEPLVIVKQNRKETLAVVKAEHFFELLRKVSNGNQS
jgi:hypothetical protein